MPTPKKTEIRIAGLGGQGVVLAGHILGKAAVNDGLQVVQTQSYGAEARGSAAKSEIILSSGKIGFPMVRKSDVLVAMNQTALDRHLKDLRADGVLIMDKNHPNGSNQYQDGGLGEKPDREQATWQEKS